MEAIARELALRKDYLEDKHLGSIYFGGGTPSLLKEEELDLLFTAIARHFEISPSAEITLEANPDDLTPERLASLRRSPVNRLSIGLQSFSEEDLRFFNRAHRADEAAHCLDLALEAGFEDLSVDLIYGSPTTTDAQWERNLDEVFRRRIPHLSCYALTVEPQTALDHFVRKGKAPQVDEAQAARQFNYLVQRAASEGYEHYEVSNFALPGRYARHNSSYWKGEHYLGVGPSAHSFDGASRQWNVAHNAKYLKALQSEGPQGFFEREELSVADRYNEYIMTGLRTSWGVSLEQIQAIDPQAAPHFKREAHMFLEQGQLVQSGGRFFLSSQARFLADGIAAALFW